jgi:hypothetical protein
MIGPENTVPYLQSVMVQPFRVGEAALIKENASYFPV